MAGGCMAGSGMAVSSRAACVITICGRATDCGKGTGGPAALVTSGMADKPSVDPATLAGFYLRKKVAGSTLMIEGSIFWAKPRMRGPKALAGGEPERGERGETPSQWGGFRGHPQENFENWMMKYAISCYQGTIFAAGFKSLIVYLFVWKIICDFTITLIIRPSV